MPDRLLGIDAGTESVRTGVFDPSGRCLGFGVSPYRTVHEHPGWAEQSPRDWEAALVDSIRKSLQESRVDPRSIRGIGLDGTSCTVVFLDAKGRPVRDAVIWMDIRAAREAEEVAATGEPALDYVGHGNVSAEWFPCKTAWVKRHEPEAYAASRTVFEFTDWLAFRLTGEKTVNIDTATIRWFYNAHRDGFPLSLYRKLGLEDLFEKVPQRIVKVGEPVGGLSREMAAATGLPAGIPVAGGGAAAYIGVIGMNALTPGTIALITGSSHLQIGISDREIHARGLFGSFPEALVPGLQVIEAGQISTGSVVRWFTSNFVCADISAAAEKAGRSVYDELHSRAASIPPGAEGLVVLEHWQGNRTPWTDPWSRGVIRGLTLGHGPAHVYRAILEGVAFGTEVILRRMAQEGVRIGRLVACGGATASPLWMQIHADVSGKRIEIPEEQQAVTLGSAIAGAVAAGLHPGLPEAASAMVRVASVVEPDARAHARYAELVEHYVETYESLKEASRRRVEAG